MRWLDRIPTSLLIIASVLLGLAPFVPEPHLAEKTRMLLRGDLVKPVDVFDLVFHALPALLLAVQVSRKAAAGKKHEPEV